MLLIHYDFWSFLNIYYALVKHVQPLKIIVFFLLIWVDKCERVIFNLGGHLIIRYAWGIGETINNEAEVLEIYHGLKLLTTLTKHIVIVIVD